MAECLPMNGSMPDLSSTPCGATLHWPTAYDRSHHKRTTVHGAAPTVAQYKRYEIVAV